jgi:cytochrome P450
MVLLRFGPFPAYLVSHPDDVHDVLVRQAAHFHKSVVTKIVLGRFLGDGLLISDGEFWKRQRRLEQPAFHSKRISAYAEAMVALAEDQAAGWRDGVELDVDAEMMRLTLRIVARTLFDADVADAADAVGEALTTILHISNQQTGSFIMPLPIWVPTPRNFRERGAVATLDGILKPIIEQRRSSGEDKGDLLSMLLLARDEDGARMSDKQVRDEAMTIFLAGHETTANALNWTWVLLAQNPQVEARLHAELDAALGDRAPTLDDLPRLPYTDMVIKEAMRLYPPAWLVSREPTEDVVVGGYPVKKAETVLMSPYILHHDPRWWDEPERFIPERFSPENEARLHKHAYIPFGSGPRICIGSSFALMEARLLLAALARRWRLHLVGDAPDTEPLITLRPLGGLPMRLERRQRATLNGTS